MWGWEFILMYKIHCNFSTRLEKKDKKKDNQNHVCILLHQEALSVIRCVLLPAYSYWYLLQTREREVQLLSSNSNPFMRIFNTSCGAKNLCHWSEELAVSGESKMGNTRSIPRPYFNEIRRCIRWRTMRTQEVNSYYLKTWQNYSLSEWFLLSGKEKKTKHNTPVSLWISEIFHKPEKQP